MWGVCWGVRLPWHVVVQVQCCFASHTQRYELQYPSTVDNNSSTATGGCSQPPSPPRVKGERGTAARCASGTRPPARIRCSANQRSPLTSTGLTALVSTRSCQRQAHQRLSALSARQRCRWSAPVSTDAFPAPIGARPVSAGQRPTAPGLPAPGSAGAIPAPDSADARQHSPAPSPSADQG